MRNAEVDYAISVTASSAGTAHQETTRMVVKIVIGLSHFIPGLRSSKIHVGIFIRILLVPITCPARSGKPVQAT